MKRFHFDCGDSHLGPIGFCAQVKAETKEQAVEKLGRVLDEQFRGQHEVWVHNEPDIEYLTVYFGDITEKMIDDEDETTEE